MPQTKKTKAMFFFLGHKGHNSLHRIPADSEKEARQEFTKNSTVSFNSKNVIALKEKEIPKHLREKNFIDTEKHRIDKVG